MPNKTAFLRGIVTCIVSLGATAYALAGDVKLVSDTHDSVCRVEITSGPNAPDGAPVEQFTDVERDWSITKPGKLCYRRASTPDNCESGMTQWNTRWRCAENADAGIKELSLQ